MTRAILSCDYVQRSHSCCVHPRNSALWHESFLSTYLRNKCSMAFCSVCEWKPCNKSRGFLLRLLIYKPVHRIKSSNALVMKLLACTAGSGVLVKDNQQWPKSRHKHHLRQFCLSSSLKQQQQNTSYWCLAIMVPEANRQTVLCLAQGSHGSSKTEEDMEDMSKV